MQSDRARAVGVGYDQSPAQPVHRRRRWPWVILALLAAGVVLVAAVLLYGEYKIHSPQGTGSAPVPFQVVTGDTPATICTRLVNAGLLHNSFLFKIDSRLQGLGSKLRYGTYTLRRNMSIDQMIATLANGKARLIPVAVPPGLRAGQIAEILTADGFNGKAFMYTVKHPNFPLGFKMGARRHDYTLNGFLFPDTYLVDPGTSGSELAKIMVRQFSKEFTPAMGSLAQKEHRSIYHLATTASIIEREDQKAFQKPLIASVYYNRLQSHMFMDSDPTVQFGLGRPGNWWPELSIADYQSVHSPYNTYLHMGYPPGPIANPDLSSLMAALHPAHTQYFYFSGKGNTGLLLFAKTLQEQQANIAKYG